MPQLELVSFSRIPLLLDYKVICVDVEAKEMLTKI